MLVQELEQQCQTFSTALLDHVRTSAELETMLNYSAEGDVWEPGDRQTLARLELAIRFTQKDVSWPFKNPNYFEILFKSVSVSLYSHVKPIHKSTTNLVDKAYFQKS